MDKLQALDINRVIRNNMKNVIKSMTEKELTTIADGFNNHMLWNFGHSIVTQNILCYKLSGIQPVIEENIIEKYKKGTSPSDIEDITLELNNLLTLADSTIEQLAKDLEVKDFSQFNSYETSFGYKLTSIDDALSFNNVHESLHLGYIMAQRKAIRSK